MSTNPAAARVTAPFQVPDEIVPQESFVATAMAIALVMDAVRLPGLPRDPEAGGFWVGWLVLVATLGSVAGTAVGTPLLRHLPAPVVRRTLSILLVLLVSTCFRRVRPEAGSSRPGR